MKRILRFAGLFVWVSFALSRILSAGSPTTIDATNLPAPKWPVGSVQINTSGRPVFGEPAKMLYIEAATGVPLSKLVDFSIFGRFEPGLDFDNAVARFGQPTRIRTAKEGRAAIYDSPTARIEVEDYLYGSVFSDYHRRTVFAYPKMREGRCLSATTILDQSLTLYVPAKRAVELNVEAEDGQFVFILVRDGCVKGINWGKGVPIR